MSDNILIFVYGTLKAGFRLHDYLGANSAFIANYTTNPDYTMYNLYNSFPGVVEGGNTAITGEIYSVSRQNLVLLDKLEGYPAHYIRKTLDTPYGPAWIYLYNKQKENLKKVSSGVWDF